MQIKAGTNWQILKGKQKTEIIRASALSSQHLDGYFSRSVFNCYLFLPPLYRLIHRTNSLSSGEPFTFRRLYSGDFTVYTPFSFSMSAIALCSSPVPFPSQLPIKPRRKPKLYSSDCLCLSFSCNLTRLWSSHCSTSKNWSTVRNGAVSTFACSTSSFVGRIGSRIRQGNFSLLSFGLNSNAEAEATDGDSSQLLSALLPFVVAATAIAALTRPSTFTW